MVQKIKRFKKWNLEKLLLVHMAVKTAVVVFQMIQKNGGIKNNYTKSKRIKFVRSELNMKNKRHKEENNCIKAKAIVQIVFRLKENLRKHNHIFMLKR